MTLSDFSSVFAVLAIQLGKTDADEATIRAYFKALEDLDIELVAMAAENMGRRGGSQSENPHWFPKASEWRTRVEWVEQRRIDELRARLRKLPTPVCQGCSDTGWCLNETTNRVQRCDCLKLRRLEILGRRPMPELPPAPEAA